MTIVINAVEENWMLPPRMYHGGPDLVSGGGGGGEGWKKSVREFIPVEMSVSWDPEDEEPSGREKGGQG